MKEITVKLTESEIEILMMATEGESARIKNLIREGTATHEKMDAYTDKLCAVNSKLYQVILKLHEKAA